MPYTFTTFNAVLSFLGVIGFFPESVITEKTTAVIARSHAGFKISGWAGREVQVKAAQGQGQRTRFSSLPRRALHAFTARWCRRAA